MIDRRHPRQGEVDDFPGSASAPGEGSLQPLRVGVLELDARAPGERIPEGQDAPHAGRPGDGPREIPIALRVDGPRLC